MGKVKGVILAGGNGTRLLPMTKVTNKHLLPVYDKPMIYYPLEVLLKNGITDIMIVTGKEHMGDLFRLMGSGKEFGCKFTYKVQDEAGGIAEALSLCEDFAAGQTITVILGDNIFHEVPKIDVGEANCILYLYPTDNPQRFGVPRFESGKIIDIIEKPKDPPSQYAVTGLYVYDSSVFEKIKKLKPSERGELEITDVNKMYIKKGIHYEIFEGFWSDAGTIESLNYAANYMRSLK